MTPQGWQTMAATMSPKSNESNNSTTIHFTVNAPVAPVLPDLDVDSITPNAASVFLGSNFSFSYVIKDIGAGAVTAASWAGIFLDGQATTLFGGTSPSGWNHIGPMAAGGAVTALNSFSTAGLSLGDHTLTVKADYWNDATGMANSGNNDVAESNEANNATTIHFTVTAATLLVQSAAANGPVTIAAGQTVEISSPYLGRGDVRGRYRHAQARRSGELCGHRGGNDRPGHDRFRQHRSDQGAATEL